MTNSNAPAETGSKRRIVVIGGGFGGFFAMRHLRRRLRNADVHLTIVSDTDGLLYQPLLPDVAVGAVDPRGIAVPLVTSLSGVELVRGRATAIDLDARRVTVGMAGSQSCTVGYDQLLLTVGGVTRLFDIPGLADNAVGFKTVAEALYLRELVLQRMEQADVEPDPTRKRALLTFLVVGAGYAGTELTAQMVRMTRNLVPVFRNVGHDDVRWLLVDVATAVMPELGPELGSAATTVLRQRGVDVRMKTSVKEMTPTMVTLTDGTRLDCSTVVWCAGVTANPLVDSLGLPTERGRLVVNPTLDVPGHPDLFALGDCAAVPDLTKPAGTDGKHPLCPTTAQHSMRQGPVAARNMAAAVLGHKAKPYRHHDLGLVVDLGGAQAAAKPLGINLRGVPAKIVTRGYHLYALPSMNRRLRVGFDWLTAGRTPDDVSFGMRSLEDALAAHAEHH